jgi:hypothetical protein
MKKINITTDFKTSKSFKLKLAKICPLEVKSIRIKDSCMTRGNGYGSYYLSVIAEINGNEINIKKHTNNSKLWDDLNEMQYTDYKYQQFQQKNAYSLIGDRLEEYIF